MMPAVEKVTVWVVVNKRTGQYLGASGGWWGWYAPGDGRECRYESEDDAQGVRDLLPMRMQKHAEERPLALPIERFVSDGQSGGHQQQNDRS